MLRQITIHCTSVKSFVVTYDKQHLNLKSILFRFYLLLFFRKFGRKWHGLFLRQCSFKPQLYTLCNSTDKITKKTKKKNLEIRKIWLGYILFIHSILCSFTYQMLVTRISVWANSDAHRTCTAGCFWTWVNADFHLKDLSQI